MGCQASRPPFPREQLESDINAVDLQQLAGRWYVAYTTFPMWLKGKKLHPTFNYVLPVSQNGLGAATTSASAKNAKPGELIDRVEYDSRKHDVHHGIKGIDTQDKSCPAHFKWRGASGALKLVSSDWYVVHANHAAGVMAIVFTKTAFTPDGIDIIVRDPSAVNAPEQQRAIQECRERVGRIARYTKLIDKLKMPPKFDENIAVHHDRLRLKQQDASGVVGQQQQPVAAVQG